MQTPSHPITVSEHLFHPMLELLPGCLAARCCPTLSDPDWLKLCLSRVLHDCKSGRAFLQQYGSAWPNCPDVGPFFESLKSKRRLRLVSELNAKLQLELARASTGLLTTAPALKDFELYAGDGHWHGAAVHDALVKDATKYATGHFYGLNLRTQAMVHLTWADQEARLKEHDMRALKRLDIQLLRQGAPKGKKVLWVWDKAGIDFRQWHRWKDNWGIYFVSCAKENMKLEVLGQSKLDPLDPINAGVVADELVSTSQGVMVRRVTYVDPVTGRRFEFLTNELTLAPGWIAHLYRLRWDIEKVFDEFKNKLSEKKAWASTPTAKQVQAQLLCLAHNLLLLFQAQVLEPAGVKNEAEDNRRYKRLAQAKQLLKEKQQVLPQLVESLLRCTQTSVKFIRWLRAHFFSLASCAEALPALRALYAKL